MKDDEVTSVSLKLTVLAEQNPDDEGKQIDLDLAVRMINEYQKDIEDTDLRSLLINADLLRDLVANPSCKHVRFFFAKRFEEDKHSISPDHTLVIVGVDKKGSNMIEKSKGGTYQIYEDLGTCPGGRNCHKTSSGYRIENR